MRSELFCKKGQGGMFAVANAAVAPNNIFWVNSDGGSDSAGYGRNPDAPFDTIDYAIGQCTASKGDIVYVMPGHTESVATVGAITVDIAGVSIIGLGNGSNKPLISISGTAGTIAVSAANVTLKNLRVTTGIDEVVTAISITAANCTIDAVDFVAGTGQLRQFILTAAAADYLTVKNCYHYAPAAAAAAQLWIDLIACDFARIVDNTFILALFDGATSAAITSSTADCVNAEISRNRILQTGGTTQVFAINLGATGTGIVTDNRVGSDDTTGTITGLIVGGAAYFAENYVSHAVAFSGVLAPAVHS